jgi:hypothetical protein
MRIRRYNDCGAPAGAIIQKLVVLSANSTKDGTRMRKHSIRLATALGIVALSLLLMSAAAQCTLTEGGGSLSVQFPTANPTAEVVDAYTGNPVSGVDLTLSYVSGAPEDEAPDTDFTGTTGSEGTYTISEDVPYGTYTLTAEKDGWTFIPGTVRIAEGADTLPTIIGVEPEEDFTISIIATWASDFDNAEVHVTYPGGYGTGDNWNGQADGMDSPNDNAVSILNDDNGGSGFFPEEVDRQYRGHLYPGLNQPFSDPTVDNIDATGSTDPAIAITQVDSDGSGPETVAIRTVPVDYFTNLVNPGNNGTFNITPDSSTNMLPENGSTYAWIGVLNYYVHGRSGNLMTEGETATENADLTVYVIQGENVLGKYRLPEFTTIDAARLIRVNLLAENTGTTAFPFFQLVPEQQLVAGADQTEDITPAGVPHAPEVINVQMRR